VTKFGSQTNSTDEREKAIKYKKSKLYLNFDKISNWTILLEVNNGAFDLFRNWYNYFLKLSVRYTVIVIAEDDIVFKSLQSDSYKSIRVHRSDYISISNATAYNTTLFRKLMSVRATHLLIYLPFTHYLLFSDVDTVWLHDPIPYFRGNYDLWMPLDKKMYCAGFFVTKSNSKTTSLVQKWEYQLKEQESVNQIVFNNLIHMTKEVNVATLNKSFFPSGEEYFNRFSEDDRAKVVIVHNNFIKGIDKKIDRFKSFNLWSV
jgi:hypothetical protein